MPLHPERRILNQTTYYAHVTLGAPLSKVDAAKLVGLRGGTQGRGGKAAPLSSARFDAVASS
jgi:hypothetical protein